MGVRAGTRPTQVSRGARMGGNPSTCFVPALEGPRPTTLSCRCIQAPQNVCGVAGLRVRRRGFGRKTERRRDDSWLAAAHGVAWPPQRGNVTGAQAQPGAATQEGQPPFSCEDLAHGNSARASQDNLLQKSKSQAEVAQQRCESFGGRQRPKEVRDTFAWPDERGSGFW